MIPVEKVVEPARFDAEVRQKGNQWLTEHPDAIAKEFPDYWSPFREHLECGFNYLCGYSAMWTGKPTVAHFIPKSCPEGRALVYEWSNYRFADKEINKAKDILPAGILDPLEVSDGWFEILLPNLEMIMTDDVPQGSRGDARATLRQLGLGDGDAILRIRRGWYEQFTDGETTLKHLSRHAPLIARAVKKRLDEIPHAAIEDAQTWFDEFVRGIHTFNTLRTRAPHLAAIVEQALDRPDPRYVRRS